MPVFFPEATGDEASFRKKAREFADGQIRPTAQADEAAHRFRREIFEGMANAGLTNVGMPKELGGQGASARTYYAVIEELARASASYAITVGVTNLVQGGILKFGNAEQKEIYLKPLLQGKWLGAFSLSEPGAGSDAAALQTKAVKVDKGYRITGSKSWCSNGGLADLYLLMARTSADGPKGISAFLVRKDTPGFRIGKQEKKLGLWASTLTELIFEDCFIPEDQMLGKPGEGLQVALSQLDAGRISIASVGSGLAEEALRLVWALAGAGRFDFQDGVKSQFAGHYASLQALKALLALAAEEKDRGTRVSALASQAKLLGSDLAMQVTSDAITAVGPLGAQVHTGLERLFRDAKALQIVEGTNQIQRLVLARELDKLFAP